MGNNNRDDFSLKTKDVLAKRVGYKCSNPTCKKPTSGPHSDPDKAINIGVAAHICAAAPGGPRYDPSMSSTERSSVKNGIWLCQTCSAVIDKDETKYPVRILREWKENAEQAAEINQTELGRFDNGVDNLYSMDHVSIRPNLKNSNRKSHKLLRLTFDLQIDRNVEETIQAIRDALSAEKQEETPDECTIAFARYLLTHYLLSDVTNIPEALNLIEEIMIFDEVKNDDEFYSDVMTEKAKALVLSGKVALARNALSLVKCTNKAPYLEAVGLVLLYEGKVEQAIETLTNGQNKALQEYVAAVTEDEKKASYQHYYSFLTQLGTLYRCIQRPDLSLSLWKKAVTAADDIGYTREKARSLLPYVECLIQYDRLEDALVMLKEAYSIKEYDNDDDFFWHYYNLKAAIHVKRNSQEQNDVQQAVESLQKLLERGLEANKAITVLRTIAHVQAENGLNKAAKDSLNLANQIVEASKKSDHKEGIEVQLNNIKKGERPLGNNQYRPSVLPPSSEQIRSMIDMYHLSEVSVERLELAFDIGMGYINTDSNLSYTWLKESEKQANSLLNKPIEARSLIGQAMLLFGEKTEEGEETARTLIDRALRLMSDIPIWDIRARATMFKGMALAHVEDFAGAYNCFQEANQIVKQHKVKDLDLEAYIEHFLNECRTILSRSQFTDFDFEVIIRELAELKCWFPKYSKELQQFLWYNRQDDIERLIITAHGSKAFMVSDSKDEINEWLDGLSSLFEIVSFTSESDYHNEHNWNFSTMLPVPENMRSDYFNVFCVLNA